MAPDAPDSRDPRWVWPRALAPWLAPLVAAGYLVGFAPGPGVPGIPYPVVILGPVATFLGGSLIVAAVGEARRSDAARIVMSIGLILAVLPAVLAGGEALRVVHAGLRGQTLLALGLLGGGAFAGGRLTGLSGHRPTALLVLVALAVAAMLETDLRLIDSVFDRDLLLYLQAGNAVLHGLPVYTDAVLTQPPLDPTQLPFVYPPVTLPFLAVLSVIPRPIMELLWLGLAGGASVASLRCFGVRWPWLPILLLWPPFVQGFWTGNASILLLLAFAATPFAPALLALPPLIKLPLGLTGLWLPRERRWRALGRGLAVVAVLILVTLPLVGMRAWQDWLGGLAAFAQSTANIPVIQGVALTRFVGPELAIGLAAGLAVVAFLRKGRDSLAAFGLASLALSPTLYLHGLTPALASFLRLRASAFWFLMAVSASFARGQAWWLVVGILVVAPLVPVLLATDGTDATLHPIGPGHEVWPVNPFSRSGRQP